MESLMHTIKAKGLTTTIRKIGLNLKRYHFGTKKTMNRFKIIAEILNQYNAKMTIHVPAILLEYHLTDFKSIDDTNIEWAMHGYKHIDHSKLDYHECLKHLKMAKAIFDKNEVNIKGFRAPYLKGGDKVIKVLSQLGLVYDSSSSVFIDVINRNQPKIKTILDFYSAKDNWNMKKKLNVFEIPVILPDDEMLVDRLGFKGREIGNTWIHVAKKCLKNDWIFVLQLHPDRVEPCSTGLKMVLDWADKNNIWLPSLSEIAILGRVKDGYKGALAITGDLDLFSIWDYKRIS